MQENEKENSIREIIESILKCSIEDEASDIHIDPSSSLLNVRIRKHGFIKHACSFPMAMHQEMISCIKIIAKLRTDIHQSAQDGRYEFCLEKSLYDIRISIVPTLFGENAVLRILEREAAASSFETLGFSKIHCQIIRETLSRSAGLIVVSGPTGAGKTTTLQSMLKAISRDGRNIVTLEDPIEYVLAEARQIQINYDTSIHFNGMLRSILRQDPDVIMIGEIRDGETAESVARMALTGHLALSTVHSSSAIAVVSRLTDMGITRALMASSLSLIVHQKLIKKICNCCKEKNEAFPWQEKYLEKIRGPTGEMPMLFRGKGCDECEGRGFAGRICVNEVLPISEALREAIVKNKSVKVILEKAISEGFVTMSSQLFELINTGSISLDTAIKELLA